MATAGMLLGVFCVFGMMVGMVPFLGWVNWFNIPLSFIALLMSGAGVATGPRQRSQGIVGIILAIAAIGFGGIRWVLGGFVF